MNPIFVTIRVVLEGRRKIMKINHLTSNKNKKRTLIYLLLTILFLTTLTACSPKSTIDSNEFITKVEALGYDVLDDSEQCRKEGPATTCLYIEEGSVSIGFIVFDSSNHAVAGFNQVKQQAEYYKGSVSSSSSTSISNYNKYSQSSGDTYFYIIRIGNTLFYSSCDKSQKHIIDDIVKAIGYK